jgi:AcrR family transcriptional regulator
MVSQKTPVRGRILATARNLFYSRGINATGVDTVIAQANVAKASLYHHFASKELLVAAYLAELRIQFEVALEQAVNERGFEVEIPFEFLESALVGGEFFGCPFTNALTEMPESKAVAGEVRRYRKRVLEFFARAANGNSSLAEGLMLIYDGAFTSCKLDPKRKRVQSAKAFARQLVKSAELFGPAPSAR